MIDPINNHTKEQSYYNALELYHNEFEPSTIRIRIDWNILELVKNIFEKK